jgi:hypothetical protein
MILVDTSVLIDYFRGVENKTVGVFDEVLQRQLPFGLTSQVFQEILQGAKTRKEFERLQDFLATQRFYHPLHPVESFAAAAEIYFECRRRGLTVRSSVDCLIARIAVEHNLMLLHNDKDYEMIAEVVELQFFKGDL